MQSTTKNSLSCFSLIIGLISFTTVVHSLTAKEEAQLNLMNCEEEASVNEGSEENLQNTPAQTLFFCIEKVFQDKRSSCLLNVQYIHDKKQNQSHQLIKPLQSFRYTNLRRRKLVEKCMNSTQPKEDVEFKYYQLKALAVCMEEESFTPFIENFSSAKNLSSCMIDASQNKFDLDSSYNALKTQLYAKADQPIALCIVGEENYNWCKSFLNFLNDVPSVIIEHIENHDTFGLNKNSEEDLKDSI